MLKPLVHTLPIQVIPVCSIDSVSDLLGGGKSLSTAVVKRQLINM